YLVSEALTNAARHSGASAVSVDVALLDAGLRVEVCDGGCGGANRGSGSGLSGLADRLAALGAELEVDSPGGGGTRIATVLPCG
ncbi:sensor histidine kinase, partial [Actinokineospora sp.]|uniref:sensor histidine kinase n=1 Tax=Actinokineospora sp. TaxID=1872133 RepID=UPI003D6AE91A